MMGEGATGVTQNQYRRLLAACVQPDTKMLRPDHCALQIELDPIRGAAQVSSWLNDPGGATRHRITIPIPLSRAIAAE